MGVTIYDHVEQRSDEWYELRCGIITASVVGKLITLGAQDTIEAECPECSAIAGEPCLSLRGARPMKTYHDGRAGLAASLPRVLRLAETDTARSITHGLVAERITGRVDQSFTTRDMWRGVIEEPLARDLYAEHRGVAVREVGFIVREEEWGTLGYSPDGLVGDDGLIEIKSRNQKRQVETVLDEAAALAEHMPQMQAGLLASGREWCDLVGYSSGMPVPILRVHPDPEWFAAIIAAVQRYEATAKQLMDAYFARVQGLPVAPITPDYEEITV